MELVLISDHSEVEILTSFQQLVDISGAVDWFSIDVGNYISRLETSSISRGVENNSENYQAELELDIIKMAM